MRIKKISPTTPANGNIENQYGTSQTNAYSEEYSNTTFATKDVATTSANGLMSSTDKSKLDGISYEVVTGNGWTMNKYSDGTLEGWITYGFSTVINTAWGVLYRNADTVDFPTYPINFLTNTEPFVNINGTINQRGGYTSSCIPILFSGLGNTPTQLKGIILVRPDSSSDTRNCAVSAYVRGKWK